MSEPAVIAAFPWSGEGSSHTNDRGNGHSLGNFGPQLARLAQNADQAGFPVAADHLAYLASVVSYQMSSRRT